MKMASSGFRAALLLGTHLALLSCAAAFSMGGSFAPATAASRFLRPAVCLKGDPSMPQSTILPQGCKPQAIGPLARKQPSRSNHGTLSPLDPEAGHVSAAARRGRGAALGVVASDGGGGVDAMTIKFAAGLKEHLTELWGPPGTEDFSLYADDLEFKDPLASAP